MAVAVIGGGIIGLAVAWRLVARGADVTVVDPQPGAGASHAAGGMLAPVTEVHYGEEPLLALNLDSSRRWPRFAAELEAASGMACGYRTEGTLAVAVDAGDRAVQADLAEYLHGLGLDAQRLGSRECRRLEPMLAPGIGGGLLVPQDRSVDNRRLVAALLEACCRLGVRVVRDRATGVEVTAGRADGVRLASGEAVPADVVVLAAGAGSAGLEGVPPGAVRVRPVKGEILRLRVPEALRPLLSRTVRGIVAGSPVYLVPRAGGELVVGATSQERGDTTVTAGGVHQLLRDARALLPAVDELELVDAVARLRPCTPDNAPAIGPTALPGLVAATGHYRNGVLLAPLTADAVASIVVDGQAPAVVEPFTPNRFDRPARRAEQEEVPA